VARTEGVFCEPSSAAGVAGLQKAIAGGVLQPEGKKIACVLTGHGLKDPDSAVLDAPAPLRIASTLDALIGALKA
jgi:threonine synthase